MLPQKGSVRRSAHRTQPAPDDKKPPTSDKKLPASSSDKQLPAFDKPTATPDRPLPTKQDVKVRRLHKPTAVDTGSRKLLLVRVMLCVVCAMIQAQSLSKPSSPVPVLKPHTSLKSLGTKTANLMKRSEKELLPNGPAGSAEVGDSCEVRGPWGAQACRVGSAAVILGEAGTSVLHALLARWSAASAVLCLNICRTQRRSRHHRRSKPRPKKKV